RLNRLEAALGSAGPDPSPALMIPHLSGAPGPWPDSPGSAGAVSGLTLATTGADLVRAALEGIAIDLVLAIEALRAGGSPILAGPRERGGETSGTGWPACWRRPGSRTCSASREGRRLRSTTASRAGPGSSTSWCATSARERTPRTRTPG